MVLDIFDDHAVASIDHAEGALALGDDIDDARVDCAPTTGSDGAQRLHEGQRCAFEFDFDHDGS